MRLQAVLGGAVAVVTGRGLAVARGYAGVPSLPIGAEHGAVLDPALPGAVPLPVPSPEWRRAADELRLNAERELQQVRAEFEAVQRALSGASPGLVDR